MAATIRDWLEIDHRRLERLLDDSDREGQFDAPSFAAFRARLLRHIGIEEKIVFAAVRDALGQPMSRARQIRVEHAAIASLLVPAPDLALVGELRALLRAHDELEEGRDGVYAECETVLGPSSADLVARAEAFPDVPVAPHVRGDGPGIVRTAADALRNAQRVRSPRA